MTIQELFGRPTKEPETPQGRACRNYAEWFDHHAEMEMVYVFAGNAEDAEQHRIAADIARRAWIAEVGR